MAEAVPIIRTAKLSMLTADQALANWPTVAGFLEKAIPYTCGRITIDEVRGAIEQGMGVVVIAWDPKEGAVYAAYFCEVEQYKTGRKCWNVALCGGHDIEEWKHLWPVMKEIGKAQGCDQIELTGRPAWGRVLGLKEVSRTYIEDL